MYICIYLYLESKKKYKVQTMVHLVQQLFTCLFSSIPVQENRQRRKTVYHSGISESDVGWTCFWTIQERATDSNNLKIKEINIKNF